MMWLMSSLSGNIWFQAITYIRTKWKKIVETNVNSPCMSQRLKDSGEKKCCSLGPVDQKTEGKVLIMELSQQSGRLWYLIHQIAFVPSSSNMMTTGAHFGRKSTVVPLMTKTPRFTNILGFNDYLFLSTTDQAWLSRRIFDFSLWKLY